MLIPAFRFLPVHIVFSPSFFFFLRFTPVEQFFYSEMFHTNDFH